MNIASAVEPAPRFWPVLRLVLVAVLGFALASTWLPALTGSRAPDLLDILLAPLMLGIVVFFAVQPTIYYRLRGDALEVRTFWRTLRFPLGEIALDRTPGFLAARLFGTAAPGYYTGTFAFALPKGQRGGPATVHALATTGQPPQGGIMLRHRDKTYYLTPADSEAFLALLKRGAA